MTAPDADPGGRRGDRAGLDDGTAEIARQRHTDAKKAERKLGLLLVAPAGDHHARGGRLPDPLRVLAVAEQGRPAQAGRRTSSSGSTTTSPCCPARSGGPRSASRCSSPSSARSFELVFGMLLAIVMHRTIVGRGLVRTSALVPYAIVTVVAAFSWRFAWTEDLGWLTPERVGAAHRVLAVDLDHHPGRGLEDDPVHGAAADGGPGPGAGGPAQGGLDGRRERLEAVLDDHRAADQAGHPGGAAVPHPRRVPGLRQHLHPDQRVPTAPARCRWSPTAT